VRGALLACVLLAMTASTAGAGITRLEILRVEPFAGGEEFGEVGGYVKVVGIAHGELDPAARANAVIVNLDRAPRNARGMVEYAVDFYVMRPADPLRGNRTVLYEATNRGRKLMFGWLHDAKDTSPGAVNEPTLREHVGNAFALTRGYTLVWSGWDPDAPAANGGLRIRVPVATDRGRPIVRVIRDEFVFGTRLPATSPTAPLSYEAATLDQAQARLTVRAREADPPTEIPASGWSYQGPRAIALVGETTAFRPGFIYDFRYPAKDPKIIGIGFAATRDLVSFLRYEARDRTGTPNPVTLGPDVTGVKAVLAFGVSQGGRFLRDHVAAGFNRDEARRRVFDGVLSHVAGVGRVFANYEFGQPNRTATQHEDHLFPENAFPFSHATLTDPVTGATGALLRGDPTDPLMMEVNTSTEYWQKGASLLHTDPGGGADALLPTTARVYMVAGTQHGGRATSTSDPGPCLHPRNPHSAAPVLRALLVALDAWVVDDLVPPESRVPTVRDGTLVTADRLGFPAIPGIKAPVATNRLAPFGDWTSPRPQPDRAYGTRVSKVDADGNEVEGIRLPAIAAPIATYTGWNHYRAPELAGELCDRDGIYAPLPVTKAERERAGDPRRSLEERYGTREAWLEQVRAAAAQLVIERLLLTEDAARIVAAAERTDPFKRTSP
jgi:hypothetical protein